MMDAGNDSKESILHAFGCAADARQSYLEFGEMKALSAQRDDAVNIQ